jgi:peptide/nickel transport system substrate-binding protein
MGRAGTLTMGTGPWKFDSFDPTRGIELSANPSYWGGNVPVRRISIKFIPDSTSAALAFRAGELDLVIWVTDPKGFQATSGSRSVPVATCGLRWLAMNTSVPPWNDVHVRRAVAYAVNRKAFAEAMGGADASQQPILTMITPTQLRTLGSKADVDRVLKGIPTYPFSLAKAKAEMAKSRYPNGFSFPMVARTDGTQAQGVQAIAGMLAQIGLKADIKTVTVAQWLTYNAGQGETVTAHMTGLGGICDPSAYPEATINSKTARPGGFNVANYKNSKADALIEAGSKTLDRGKRLAIYGELLKVLARDVPYVPLITVSQNYALSNRFRWEGFNLFTRDGRWAMSIKPR